MRTRDTFCSKSPPVDPRDPAASVPSAKPVKEPVEHAGSTCQHQSGVNTGGLVPNDPPRRPHASIYAVPFDGWFRELDEVLIEYCKRGRDGQRQVMVAIRSRHPQISPDTIWARIVYLELTTSKRPPYRRYEWSVADLEVLGAGYRDGRNGASRTIDLLLGQHPDWSRSVIWRKAKSLGLSRRRNGGYRPWSEGADRMLISCEGFEMEGIEKRMKRSIASIRSRLAALDRGAEFFGGFKTKDLMEMFHLDQSAIRRLERKRLLLRERGRITEDSLRSLCREHPEEIPFETLDEGTKRMLVADYDYAKPKRRRQGGRKKKQPFASGKAVPGSEPVSPSPRRGR
jgi:hypothetical protein